MKYRHKVKYVKKLYNLQYKLINICKDAELSIEEVSKILKIQYVRYFRVKLLVRKGSLWVGAHWSPYNQRLCINLLPCITIKIDFLYKEVR